MSRLAFVKALLRLYRTACKLGFVNYIIHEVCVFYCQCFLGRLVIKSLLSWSIEMFYLKILVFVFRGHSHILFNSRVRKQKWIWRETLFRFYLWRTENWKNVCILHTVTCRQRQNIPKYKDLLISSVKESVNIEVTVFVRNETHSYS